MTVCLLSTACLALACNGGGSDGDDEAGPTDTDTGTDTGETADTNTESGSTAETTDDATTDDDVDTTTDDTTDDTTTDDTTDDTTTDDTTETADTTTDDGAGVCGNSIIEGDEQCDDGNLSDEDGCLSSCVNASCGDGFVNMGVEACDDGVNDGMYGGCEADCASLAPYCGDGELDVQYEECDDANPELTDGCQPDCVVPSSCLTLLDYDDSLVDGDYMIAPDGYMGDPFEVYCDMTSDGGGYTFLKVDNGAQAYAVDAEAECDSWGMQLWIPRSVEHKDRGWAIANDGNIGSGANPDYMRILGIYPNFNGAGCANQGMNSGNPGCQWGASDGGAWYVHDVNNISEPNGDNSTTGSMYYQWQGNGQIQWHNDIPGVGYSSAFFMCDVGDKQP